jgi:hypothetical protein
MYPVNETLVVQGRRLEPADIARIRRLIAANPGWSRRRLSESLAAEWDWRNGRGRLKDMAARSLLVKLHERGLIRLPARRQVPSNRMAARQIQRRLWNRTPVAGTLHSLGSLSVATGRLLGCLLFGSAAWKCRARDEFIGWTQKQREQNLHLITNNTRFLILPWVRIPHLASWILGQVLRRLSDDWESKYGHRIVLVETFVERDRFAGTSYKAANWIRLGATTGRSRQDRQHNLQVSVKDVYLYPSCHEFRRELSG